MIEQDAVAHGRKKFWKWVLDLSRIKYRDTGGKLWMI